MSAPASRAQDIAARLTAAGYKPCMSRRSGRIRVETDVPDSPSEASWRALLAALERADRFGLDSDSEGLTAWAVVWTVPHGRASPDAMPSRDTCGPPRPREGCPAQVDENRK